MDPTASEEFLRGILPGLPWAVEGSRLPAALTAKLTTDTVRAARVPAGVHLALTGPATALDVHVTLGERTSVPAPTVPEAFVARAEGVASVHTAVAAGAGVLRIGLPERDPAQVVRVYLPEAVEVRLGAVTPVGGDAVPAPRGPRFVAYGDSITQGWSVSEPGMDWPSIAGQALGLDVVNLGFAGSARGELLTADAVGASQADVVALAWGTNAWSSLPTDAGQITERMRLYLTALRQGLPDVPVVVISPIVRPEGEHTPNRFGATLHALREALEASVHSHVALTHDPAVTLVRGRHLVPADELVDGIHPGDAGQASLAAGLLPYRAAALDRPAVPAAP